MSKEFFSTHNLTKDFGGIHALNSLDITVHQGEIHGIIGPNGAGKTTLINVITGLEGPSAGEVFFQKNRIDQLSPELIFERGISRTFQEGKIVSNLTVLENVMIGFSKKGERDNISKNIVDRLFDQLSKEHKNKDKGRDLLEKFKLQSLAEHWADDLVWYERQLVQIARAIASEPQFLLLDEPTAGMGIDEKKMIEDKMHEINQSGVTIMLVSHDIQFIRRVSHRIT
ncbi:MAG: ABC transporter ATP-binding protein, partial [Elusimicrobiota bacterium]